MKLKCIIVDDEEDAREGLQILLEADDDIEIAASCKDGFEAIKEIYELKPDLLLLDIQMPGANGFEVLNSIEPPLPEVIFITAYDQYALKAFEVHALDYLLKPFSDERFYDAISRTKERLITQKHDLKNSALKAAKSAVANQKSQNELRSEGDDKLTIKSDGKIYFLNKDDIYWVEAYDYYIKLHAETKYYLVRDSMKNILVKLGDQFLRVHRSSIVNTELIKTVEKLGNSELNLTLANNALVKVSRNYKSDILEKLNDI